MTDAELLKKAAKAAGRADLTKWADRIVDWDSRHHGKPALYPDRVGGQCRSWNPRIDDADALRLAVKLQLTVCNEHVREGSVYCTRSVESESDWMGPVASSGANESEVIDADYDATRLAILLAAASLADDL